MMTPRRQARPPERSMTYPSSPSGQYVLTRDGQEVMRGTEQEIWQWMHRNHSYSIDHALRYEGYAIIPVEGAGRHVPHEYRVAIGGNGTVIPSRRWRHKRTGATASPYGSVPWTGAPGNREEDWEMQNVGWTIQWDDGTVGIGRPPFPTKEEAEAWLERDRARRAAYWAPQPSPGRAPAPGRRRRTARENARDDDDDGEGEERRCVVSVEKWATSSSGKDMPYDRFVFAKSSDLPDIFGSRELTVDQAISHLEGLGWAPEEFEEILALGDEGLDELVDWADEHGKGDNTYNWSWWGPTLHFIGVQDPDETGDPYKPEVYFVRAHLGGDPRGNYSGYSIFYVESPGEDAPWYAYRLTAQLTLDDGSEVLIDSEDTEASQWYVAQDPSGTLTPERSVSTRDIENAFDWEEGVDLF